MKYWLVKSEPQTFSWQDFEKQIVTVWDGVRNYQARNHLKRMKLNDFVFFYHSVSEKAIIGLATVCKEFYPDPTSSDLTWVCVDLKIYKPLTQKMTLQEIKNDTSLQKIPLIKQSRLSVMELTKEEFFSILKKSQTSL